jgi:hypothetical protein
MRGTVAGTPGRCSGLRSWQPRAPSSLGSALGVRPVPAARPVTGVARTRGGWGLGDATRARHSAPGSWQRLLQVGVVKSPEPWTGRHPASSSGEFSCSAHFTGAGQGSQPMPGTARPAGRLGSLPGRTQRRSPGTAMAAARAPGRWRGLRSGEVAPFQPIIFHFGRCYPGANELQGNNGNMGTSTSKQANAARPGADLFPRVRGRLGTWEQNAPFPNVKNPRACGIPLPSPAGERN